MKTELPDDIDLLKGMLAQHQMMLKQQQVQLRTYAGQVAGYEREIERLKAQLDKLKRMLFGQSSEKLRNNLEKSKRPVKDVLRNFWFRCRPQTNELHNIHHFIDF